MLMGVHFSVAACNALLCVIAVDSTALQALKLDNLHDDEVGLLELAGALQQNNHLRNLSLMYDTAFLPIASAFEEHLLPAVLACTSLRKLVVVDAFTLEPIAEAAGVLQLVADREAARLAAALALEPGYSA